MARLLTFECDICGVRATEETPGSGLMGWGAVGGVGPHGECILCPDHRLAVAEHLDTLQKQADALKHHVLSTRN